jgi:hypothetical protein
MSEQVLTEVRDDDAPLPLVGRDTGWGCGTLIEAGASLIAGRLAPLPTYPHPLPLPTRGRESSAQNLYEGMTA